MNVRSLSIEGFAEVYELRLAGTVAFLAIAHAARGRAFGGIRVRAYDTEEHALADALALARAMARKVALAGIDGGGAKTVVIEPAPERRAEAIAELGAFIESLGGKYQSGPDYGFTPADEAVLRGATAHVARGDLAAGTAESVARCMAVAAGPLRRVVIQGVGGVGRLLAERLVRDGVEVVAADVRSASALVDGVTTVPPDRVYDEPCDVFAPCAVGGVLNPYTIARLQCRVVCGAANNPLAAAADAERLRARGIAYVPDVIANAGATIVGASHALGEEHLVAERMNALVALATDVLSRAAREGRSPHHVAMAIADARVAALRAAGAPE
jgi:leucine dehydrogenase